MSEKLLLPERLRRSLIYGSEWINLFVDAVRLPSGKVIERYHFLDYPKESVAVLLHNAQGQILMIQTPRYITGRMEWEIPAGNIEPGETAEEAARREVAEETGCLVDHLAHIYTYHPSPGMSNQQIHIWRGQVHDAPVSAIDTDEVAAVRWFAPDDIQRMIAENKIRDGVSLVPLLLFLGRITG